MNSLAFIPFIFIAICLYTSMLFCAYNYNNRANYYNSLCRAWDDMYSKHLNKECLYLSDEFSYRDTYYCDIKNESLMWRKAIQYNVRTSDLVHFIRCSYWAGISKTTKRELI